MNSIVTLSWLETHIASMVGGIRRLTSMKAGLKDKAGRPNDWSADVEGTAGEIALAKYLNVYWMPTNKTFTLPDVGKLEVKTVAKGDELPIHPNIPDDRIVVMVAGRIPNFEVVGWIRAGDAKIKYPAKAKLYYPCHWVPRAHLDTPTLASMRKECARA